MLMAAALPALADIAPVISWSVDTANQKAFPLAIRRGETVILQPSYLQNGVAKDLTGSDDVILRYRPVGGSSIYAITGAVYSATGGLARVRWDLGVTNGAYQYEIAVISSNATLLRSSGIITVQDSLAGGATFTPPSGTGDTLAPSEPEGAYPNDIAPVLAWTVNPDTLAAYNLQLNQGETVILQPTFDGLDFSGASAVALRYRPIGASGWHYVAPGTIHNATGGVARVRWDSTVEGTNSTYQYEIAVQSADAMLLRSYGTLTIRPSLSGSSTSMPALVTVFDWQLVDHVNIGSAPFLSQVALAPFASFWASLTNGTADINVRSILVDGQPINSGGGGIGSYTNTEIAGVSHTNGVRIGNGSNLTWRLRNGIWCPDVPIVVGPQGEQGPPGQAVTNVTISITTNLTIMTMTITNITIGGGGVGSFTNFSINGIPNTSGVMIGDSINSQWTQGTDGVWRVDMSTNQTQWVINGEHIGGVDSNGITLLKGTLQLYEEDLDCNVRLYDGSRLVPSLTFWGHTNEWGLYARGYNGTTVAGWSQAGTEIGLLHGGGIKLMSTNAAFEGRLIGDISQATGYPEHEFRNWQTNMSFTALTLSNMVVTPGLVVVKDPYMVSRSILSQSGFAYSDAGGVSRVAIGDNILLKNASGLTALNIEPLYLNFLDPVSGIVLNRIDSSSQTMKLSNGQTAIALDAYNGWQFYDGSSYALRAKMNYAGISLYDSTGTNILFSAAVSNGAVTIRGQDSDSRYVMVRTNWFSGVLTNLFGGKTNICRYQYGSLTNITTL